MSYTQQQCVLFVEPPTFEQQFKLEHSREVARPASISAIRMKKTCKADGWYLGSEKLDNDPAESTITLGSLSAFTECMSSVLKQLDIQRSNVGAGTSSWNWYPLLVNLSPIPSQQIISSTRGNIEVSFLF